MSHLVPVPLEPSSVAFPTEKAEGGEIIPNCVLFYRFH